MADEGKAVGAVFVYEKAKGSGTRLDYSSWKEDLKRWADDNGIPHGSDNFMQIASDKIRYSRWKEILKRWADDNGIPHGSDYFMQIASDKIRSLGDARHMYIRSLEELVEWETEEHRKGKRAS